MSLSGLTFRVGSESTKLGQRENQDDLYVSIGFDVDLEDTNLKQHPNYGETYVTIIRF